MTPRRSGLAVALVVLVVALVGCTTSDSPTATSVQTPAVTSSPDPTPSATPSAEPSATEEAGGDEERVIIGTSDFEPATLTISAGTVVAFENEATFDHTVTEGTGGQAVEDPIVDEVVAPGGETRVNFDATGTFDITCLIHPTMQMTITVED